MNEKQKREIGKRVAKIIEGKNKDQFAKKIGMTSSNLSSLIKGKSTFSISSLIAFCEETGVTADYVLRGIENSLDIPKLVEFAKEFNKRAIK